MAQSRLAPHRQNPAGAGLYVHTRTNLRQHFADRRANHRVHLLVEGSAPAVDDDDAGAGGLGNWYQTCDGIHLQSVAARQQKLRILSSLDSRVADLGNEPLPERDRRTLEAPSARTARWVGFTGA